MRRAVLSVTVVIPAVVEPDIDKTIRSLLQQSVVPSKIIVTVNNTDDPTTREVSESIGSPLVEVRELGRIAGRKAGAINRVLDTLPREGFVMIMDADTVVSPTFVERALRDLESDKVGATGAVFAAEKADSYLSLCQRLEWVRYAAQIDRTGRTWVLSGTAAVIKWEALEDVRRRFGRWYDETSITEDGRLSVDLKVCGWRITSPVECEATTEVMPTWRMLVKQRTRWFLGALQTVRRMPYTRETFPYFFQQLMLGFSVLALWLLVTLTAVSLIAGNFQLSIFWTALGIIFVAERVITISEETLRHRIIAAMMIPEMIYAVVLQYAFIKAIIQFISGSSGEWAHVERT